MQRTAVIQPTTTVESLVQQEDNANDKAIWIVFRKMLFFTIMLTTAPMASFFISKHFIFDGMFDVKQHNTSIYATVVAVAVVHIILVAFLYVAFRDDRTGKKSATDILKESTGKKD
jgi:vacuolar ATPase assembly integral membrane protein VMA21